MPTLRSYPFIFLFINLLLNYSSLSCVNIPLKMGEQGVECNYFANLGVEFHFLKIGCSESSFPKRKRCQCNLPYIYIYLEFLDLLNFRL